MTLIDYFVLTTLTVGALFALAFCVSVLNLEEL
jgi:hypothetical protein